MRRLLHEFARRWLLAPLLRNVARKATTKELSPKQRDEMQAVLKARFEKNMGRHPGLVWAKMQARLEASPDKLGSLVGMERTGGEPDVVGIKSGEFVHMDCAPETTACLNERRN